MILYELVGCPYCQRVRYAMEALGANFKSVVYKKTEDLKTEEYLAMNPKGEAPVLVTSEGAIYESTAILRYLATLRPELGLAGKTPFEAAQIDLWSQNSGIPAWRIAELYIEIVGKVAPSGKNSAEGIENIHKSLQLIESHLSVRTYIVGHSLTYADLCWLPFLTILFTYIFEERERRKVPHVLRYWKNLINSSIHTNVFGQFIDKKYCHKTFPSAPAQTGDQAAQKPKEEKKDAPKPKDEKPKDQKPKEDKPKEQKPKEQKPKEEKPKDAKDQKPKEAKETKEEEPKEEKPKEPETSFDLYSFKTMFMNEPDRKKVVEFATSTYDVKHFSFWSAHYDKHPSEGKELIPFNNLLTNFVNRVVDLGCGKNLIAVHGIYGDEPALEIKGLWFWKSADFLEGLKDHPACEFVKWKKLDPANAGDKKLIEEYWSHIKSEEGTVEGLKVRTMKVVK